jgi:hypothetical protein
MKRPQLNKEQTDNIVTMVVLVICFGFLAAAMIVFQRNQNLVTQIVTAIINVLCLVTGFRWGSSRSANRKDETINNLLSPPDGKTELKSETPKDEKFNT